MKPLLEFYFRSIFEKRLPVKETAACILRYVNGFKNTMLKRSFSNRVPADSTREDIERVRLKIEGEAHIRKLETTLSLELDRPGGAIDPARVDALRKQLASERKKLESVYRLLPARTNRSNASGKSKISVAGEGAENAKSTTVISYFLGEEFGVGIVRYELSSVVFVIPPRSELVDLINTQRSYLATWPATNEIKGIAAASALYGALIKPVEVLVTNAHELVIIPDLELFQMSFETLPISTNSSGRTTRYLIEAVSSIRHMPADDIEHSLPSKKEAQPSRLAVFARSQYANATSMSWDTDLSNLRFAISEAESIASSVPNSIKFAETLATEKSLKAALRGQDGIGAIHIAAHAMLGRYDSAMNGIVIGKGADVDEDGILRMSEILDLGPCPLQYVVLSGCSTLVGRVPENAAHGMLGLAGALLSNGAESVVATLWDIDDVSTQIIMQRFYSELAKGTDLGSAMNRARLICLGKEIDADNSSRRSLRARIDPSVGYRHPFFWGAFVVYGN